MAESKVTNNENQPSGKVDTIEPSLQNGFAQEKQLVFKRPEPSPRKPLTPKKQLLAYENKPSHPKMFWDQLVLLNKQLTRHSCCSIGACIGLTSYCISVFYISRQSVKKTEFPEFEFTKLKHPLYQTAWLDPEKDEFYGDFQLNQQRLAPEIQDFMRFSNYTNQEINDGTKSIDEETGEEVNNKELYYSPELDTLGPANWMPLQCYSSVDYRYKQSVIGVITHGSQLEKDLLTQIKALFFNQSQIETFANSLEWYFEKVGNLLKKTDDEGNVIDKDGNIIEDKDGNKIDENGNIVVEEEEEGLGGEDPNLFTVPDSLSSLAGGAPEPTAELSAELLGRFTYKEFESQDELFDYVRAPGYGWDEDKPAVCFAYEVHENEAKNKYELELYYRTAWPNMYRTMEWQSEDAAPQSGNPQILGWTRAAYNGLNLFQVFAANSLMQRRISPEAEIMMMSVPYKGDVFSVDPFLLLVQALTGFYFIVSIVPLVYYTAYSIAREKETGLRKTLFANGLNRVTHFLSWFVHFTVINLCISLFYTLLMKPIVYMNDSFGLIFLLVFLSVESLFALVWALQPLSQTKRMAMFILTFAFFLSLQVTQTVIQRFPKIPGENKMSAAWSPITVIKITFDTYGKLHAGKFFMSFENYDTERADWSLKLGINQMIANFFVYLAIGIGLELLINAYSIFKHFFRMRKVEFDESNMGVVEVQDLQDRENKKCEAVYNFKVEKSQICCLIGNDSAQKTHLMDMLAGRRASKGTITIRDNDFFVRGKRPSITEFLAYREQNVVLVDDLTALDHLNLFAHLRSNQKSRNIRLICDSLLPERTRVESYSESQRQCLQTILALASDNSKILLLDEPTRGLSPLQRSVFIKTLWSLKKDKYVIIQSSDTELINVLADSVATVLPTGVEMLTQREIDHKIGSYKLIVEVVDSKPSDNLVRYLSKDVPDLTLEYQSDFLTYYVLPNISKHVLLKKTKFMENNKQMLGILDYEIVSLSPFDIAQRNAPQMLDLVKSFEQTVEDQEYTASAPIGKEILINDQNGVRRSDAELQEECEVPNFTENQYQQNEHSERHEEIAGESISQSEAVGAQIHPMPIEVVNKNIPSEPIQKEDEDPEMKEFVALMNEPIKKPAYRRDLHYNYKSQTTKPRIWPLQCPANFIRLIKEHWHNKCRFLALLILPALYVYAAWHFNRYYYFFQDPSNQLSPENLPFKQPILVNEKTIIGGKDTKYLIENLPMYEEAFEPTYIDTSNHTTYFEFIDDVYKYGKGIAEYPWSLGSYQFYEIDEDVHRYKILTHVNATSPHGLGLYTQFIVESVLKTALDDDDFEFKVRMTSMPETDETAQKGQYLTAEELASTTMQMTMSDYVGQWQALSLQAVNSLIFAWFMLNQYFLIQTMRDRTSQRKNFMEGHGAKPLGYWLTKYVHDLLWYLPVTLMAQSMLASFDPHMEFAPRLVFFQPLAMLPFLYCCSFMFDKEVVAVLSLFIYQIVFQQLIPALIGSMRQNAASEEFGDSIYKLFKAIPLTNTSFSMIYNSKALYGLHRFRENNMTGEGPEIQLNESDSMNGPADIQWIFVHTIFFWVILLFVLEWRLPCICCTRFKRISRREQEQFSKKSHEFDDSADMDADEDSEVAQVCDDEHGIQLRFGIKQKPKKELAYAIKGLSLRKGGRCCGCNCGKPQQLLVSNLSAEVQVGTKFAIVSEGPAGKSQILHSLTSHKSAFHIAGMIKKQAGRRTPVYTTQQTEVLFEDVTLQDNINYYTSIGSVHPRLSKQMVVSFGLYERRDVLLKNLIANEKHLLMLILALAGSSRTCILDEPFTGLTHDQTLKVVKIIRQMHDCTIIVTAKSKQQLEFLQPNAILNIRDKQQQQSAQDDSNSGFVLSMRLKPQPSEQGDADQVVDLGAVDSQPVDLLQAQNSSRSLMPNAVDLEPLKGDQLKQFIYVNYANFDKLRGKRRSLVISAVSKIMRRARMSPELCQEIAEMVYEDVEMQSSSEELALKCELMMSLYTLIEALCKRFGQVCLEMRQDDYAELRIVFNEDFRHKGIDDSFSDCNPVFSSVVEFVNSNDTVRDCTSYCQFLSSTYRSKPQSSSGVAAQKFKVFRFSDASKSLQRLKFIADVEIGPQSSNTARNSEDSSLVDNLQKGSTPRIQFRNAGAINKNYERRSHNSESHSRPREQEMAALNVSKSQVTYKNGASRQRRPSHQSKE